VAVKFIESQDISTAIYRALLRVQRDHHLSSPLVFFLQAPPNNEMQSILPVTAKSADLIFMIGSTYQDKWLRPIIINYDMSTSHATGSFELASSVRAVRFNTPSEARKSTLQSLDSPLKDAEFLVGKQPLLTTPQYLILRDEKIWKTQRTSVEGIIEPFRSEDVLTLKDLNRGSPVKMLLRERLLVALNIVVAFGKIIYTPWIPEPLTRDQIVFNIRIINGNKDTELPYFRLKDPLQGDVVPGGSTYSQECFLTLGIILLELWHGDTFEAISGVGEQVMAGSYWQRLSLVLKLRREVQDTVPVQYLQAVTICLTPIPQWSLLNDGTEQRALAKRYSNMATLLATVIETATYEDG
jgi:hypothetical protein